MSKNTTGILNDTDLENITNLIDKLEVSSFNYLKLENPDLTIVIGKNGVSDTKESKFEASLARTDDAQQTEKVENVNSGAAPAVSVQETSALAEASADAVAIEEKPKAGFITVNASTTGIFYAQPEPGAPPYVKLGDTVQEDTTVGLIEIMKVYSALSADATGIITEIHVEDGDLVEYGQPLFTVDAN